MFLISFQLKIISTYFQPAEMILKITDNKHSTGITEAMSSNTSVLYFHLQ